MTPEQWQKAKELYSAALERLPGKRQSFLDENCEDEAVRREVESLISNSDGAANFLEQPAMAEVAAEFGNAEQTLQIGEKLSHYEIIGSLGSGGMGEVYLAQDTRLRRRVALKLLSAYANGSHEHLRRFLREARSASALNHPHICTIYEINNDGETPFIAMEYVTGETLAEKIEKRLSDAEILDTALQVADALVEAHAQGFVHRDIKPANIVITPRGQAKVLDFGLAKRIVADSDDETQKLITQPGMIIGTASYMSPEQARGGEVDTRSDIFSFGVVLYEMIAGRPPFAGENMMDVIGSILNKEPEHLHRIAPGVSPDLERIVNKTLRKDRDERYQSVKDLLVDLKAIKQEMDFRKNLRRTETARSDGTRGVDTASGQNYVTTETKKRPSVFIAAFAILLSTIAGLGLWYFYSRPSNVPQVQSIAVLPFENGSGDANLDYLSDGVSESLIDRLSELPDLKVIARGSSFRYRGGSIDLREAASNLGVQALITGRVSRRGDDLNIRVEMIDVRNDRQLWSEQYVRKASDALSVQQEIAQTVSERLRSKLTGSQIQSLAKHSTLNPTAYEMLLKGRFYWNKGGDADRNKAIEYFNQAVGIDPNYALAHAELAGAYGIYANDGVLPQKEGLRRSEAAALRALELDESLAEAHQALGYKKKLSWDWAGAEHEYKRAIELNPNYALAFASYSYFLGLMGRHGEAALAAQRAKELDPVSIRINLWIFNTMFVARRYEQALDILRQMHELDPKHPITPHYRGYVYTTTGRPDEAITAFKESGALGGTGGTGTNIALAQAYAAAGQRNEALRILAELLQAGQNISLVDLASLHVALGENEKAFRYLEKAYEAHDIGLMFIGVDPTLDSLRSDARFQDLLRRVGLPQAN